MKTGYAKTNWLVCFLGIAGIAATVVAARTYFDLEQKTEVATARVATFQRLCQDQCLSMVLRDIRAGDTTAAAQRLDLLLCGNVLRTEEERAAADPQLSSYIEEAFKRIAMTRPPSAEGAGAKADRESSTGSAAAQRILAKALATTHTAQVK
jgi:hypothetical protein